MASYAGNHNRVAVIDPLIVYTDKTCFTWNERKLKDGIAIFDLHTESEMFKTHLLDVYHARHSSYVL